MTAKNWKWFGNAGHFICADWCQFHLCTQVGKYLVSTVGDYFPEQSTREILAKSKNVVLEGIGDARRADYMRKIGYDQVGCDRKFETMVFKTSGKCKAKGCGCGLPRIIPSELDFLGYNDRKSANAGHMKLCKKWANK